MDSEHSYIITLFKMRCHSEFSHYQFVPGAGSKTRGSHAGMCLRYLTKNSFSVLTTSQSQRTYDWETSKESLLDTQWKINRADLQLNMRHFVIKLYTVDAEAHPIWFKLFKKMTADAADLTKQQSLLMIPLRVVTLLWPFTQTFQKGMMEVNTREEELLPLILSSHESL